MAPKTTYVHTMCNHLVISRLYRTHKVMCTLLCLLLLSSCRTLPDIPNVQQTTDVNSTINATTIDSPQAWAQQQSWFKPFFFMQNTNSALAVAELSKYFNHSRTLTKKELTREIAITEDAYTSEMHPSIALSLAYLLSIKPSTKQIKRSTELLNVLIADDTKHENYRAFAQLLLHSISANSTHRRLLRNAKAKNNGLTKQLEALKNIELKINDRQSTTGLTELTP